MKKLFLFAAMLIASALGSDLFAQLDATKTYVIANNNDATKFMQDNGTGVVAIGGKNDNSYWKFVATSNADCYYIQNAKTGKYIQGYSASAQEVATGDAGVEYCVKADASGSYSGKYRMSCTANSPYDFSDGTLGLNWKDNNTVQSFASVAEKNPRSAWIVTEEAMPQPITGLSSPYAGVEPAVGTEYYLYNLKTGKWLGDNHVNTDGSWTSHGELGPRGRDIELKAGNADGRFQLNPKLGHNYSINGSNLYMDTGDGVTNWIFTPVDVDGVTNCYKLTTPGGKAMGATSAGWATSDPAAIAENGNVWQLVSREQRLAAMQVGDDCSWLVLGGTFPIDDSHKGEEAYRVWGGDYGSNAIGGDGHYHCNRVWELWGISNRDVYQDIIVPNGKYKFKAQAIYVSTGGGDMNADRYNEYLADPTGNTKGVVYANAVTTPMVNVYSLVTNEKVDNKNTKEIASGVWAYNGTNEFSTNIFEGKGWTDEVEVEVTDGRLRVGARVEGANSAWMLLDNFTLTYNGALTTTHTYTPLAYIESTEAVRENAFILPYWPTTATQIDTKFNVYDTSGGWCAIFCARNINAGTGISLYKNGNNNSNFGYFTGGTTGSGDNFAPFSYNTDYTVSADVTKLVLNGETYNTGNTVTNATVNPLSLFANPQKDDPMRGRIYYVTIKEGETTIYDFRPVMREDNVFGFYDAASGYFVLPARGNLTGYSYSETYVGFGPEDHLVLAGESKQYTPEAINIANPSYTWTSSDETIATVASDGTVTGVQGGSVTITATEAGGNSASYVLTVSEPEYNRYDANNVGYAILDGGSGWGDSPLSGLLDNDARTKFGCSNSGDARAIIIASEPVAVQQYSFVTGADTYNYPARNPRSWKLEGSNDNQNWTTIDEHSDYDAYMIHSVNKEEFVFSVNSTVAYKFFKFSAIAVDGFQLGEFWINEQAHTWGEPTVSASTCTVQGKKVWECTDCHTLKTEVLPLAEHVYTGGVCTCGAKMYEPVLLDNAQVNPYLIKFRHMAGSNNPVDIESGWNTVSFDDSDWDELLMPIGTNGYDNGNRNGAQVNTIWFNEYNTYWFRRPFYIDDPSIIGKLTVKIVHDDCCEVSVNGHVVRENPEGNDWTSGLGWLSIDVDPSYLVAGENVLAVYIEQNYGGAYCDFSLEAELGVEVTIGEAGYTTFVAPHNIDTMPDGVEAYACQVNENSVHLEPVTAIPAGEAVVLKNAGTYTFRPATSTVELGAENDLLPSDGTVQGANIFALANKIEGVGFYRVSEEIAVPAGKGYLVIGDAGVKSFYGFDEDDATAIEMVNGQSSMVNGPIFNLAGQRMSKQQKGVNIINGKKILK